MDAIVQHLFRRAAQAIDARVADARHQAAMCARSRGEKLVVETSPLPCPCGLITAARLWFGPCGWLCGVCLAKAPVSEEATTPTTRPRS